MRFLFINILHLIGVMFPLLANVLHLRDNSVLWLFFVSLVGIPVVTAFFAFKIVSDLDLLSKKISIDKDVGLRQMGEICFSAFWLIPNRNLLLVSDAAWSNSRKNSQSTVFSALHSSKDIFLLVLGGCGGVATYAAYSGELGVVFSRFASHVGGEWVISIILAIAPWMAMVCFFNYFFRLFIERE